MQHCNHRLNCFLNIAGFKSYTVICTHWLNPVCLQNWHRFKKGAKKHCSEILIHINMTATYRCSRFVQFHTSQKCSIALRSCNYRGLLSDLIDMFKKMEKAWSEKTSGSLWILNDAHQDSQLQTLIWSKMDTRFHVVCIKLALWNSSLQLPILCWQEQHLAFFSAAVTAA